MQAQPHQELKDYCEAQVKELNSYGWIDQRLHVVRIPIDRAMDLVLQNGLPVRASGPTGAAAVKVTPPADSRAAPICKGRARTWPHPRPMASRAGSQRRSKRRVKSNNGIGIAKRSSSRARLVFIACGARLCRECVAAFRRLLALAPRAGAQFVDPLQNLGQRPELLKEVGIDQKLNDEIPLDLTFRDEHGKTVELAQYFRQQARDSHAGLLQLPDALHAGTERLGSRR